MDLLLAYHITSVICFELDGLLQRHAQIASLIVSAKKFFGGVNFVYIFPPTAAKGLQEGRKSHVTENLLPIEGIF